MPSYTQKDLKTKMCCRILSQSRLSGNNVWLPLTFLQKLCNANNKDLHTWYKKEIYERIAVLVCDSCGFSHLKLNEIDSLEINDGNVTCLKDGKTYIVATPTSLRNIKEKMSVDNISDVVIDHVTPISITLGKDLQSTELKKISECVKEMHKKDLSLRGKKLETFAYEKFGSNIQIDFDKLKLELKQIIENSHYRLMSAKENALKGVGFSYKHIYKKDDLLYGVVEEEVLYHGKPFVVIQNLDSPDLLLEEKPVFDAWNKIEITKYVEVDIDKI